MYRSMRETLRSAACFFPSTIMRDARYVRSGSESGGMSMGFAASFKALALL